jgi:hypothetical protein
MTTNQLQTRSPTGPVKSFAPTALRRLFIQRKCACGGTPGAHGECEECREKRLSLQRKKGHSRAGDQAKLTAPPIVHEVLRSSGQPLDPATRTFMEARFGHDFKDVRVHTDAQANESARAINALAYSTGPQVVFGAGQFAPDTFSGRKLIAHELTHVIQQSGNHRTDSDLEIASSETIQEREADATSERVLAHGSSKVSRIGGNMVQRDLATPDPAVPQPGQAELTVAQINEAIRFNAQAYDAPNTRLIQNVLGGPVTGSWTADNIRSIAAAQEHYGLKKDGKVGPETFRFIVNEQGLEGTGTRTEDCLTSFRSVFHPVQVAATPGPNGTTRIIGHHVVEARFSPRCNCSEFQYRQFIAGVATASRGVASRDLATLFDKIPGGALPITMREDGKTNCPSPNYGHREQPAQTLTTAQCGENHYTDDTGATDQPKGCVYRGEDFPSITVTGMNTGDVIDLLVQFRGEIQRNGRTIETKNWTDIDQTVTTP